MNIEIALTIFILVCCVLTFLVKGAIYLINKYEHIFNYAMSVSIFCVLAYGMGWMIKDLVQVVLK